MTEVHNWIPEEIDGEADELNKLAEKVRDNNAVLAKLLKDDNVAARLKAEARVEELERELKHTLTILDENRERRSEMFKKIRAIRVALNAKGKNPIEEQAHLVFDALKSALPDHPLVTYDSEENLGGTSVRLSRTELRFIFAVLDFADDKLGDMGCNDHYLNDPDEAEAWFMKKLWRWDVEIGCDYGDDVPDPDEEAKVKDGRIWGPGNSSVAAFLKHRLKECHGKELFEDTDGLL